MWPVSPVFYAEATVSIGLWIPQIPELGTLLLFGKLWLRLSLIDVSKQPPFVVGFNTVLQKTNIIVTSALMFHLILNVAYK